MLKKLFISVIICVLALTYNASAQDPWIIQAYNELYGRAPNTWELNIYNYNLGSWNNYQELKNYIKEYQSNGYNIKTAKIDQNKTAVAFIEGNGPTAWGLISNQNGNLIGLDGASLIGMDGASFNKIAPLIGLDGATLQKLPVMSFADASSRSLQAVSSRYVKKASGRGRIVFNNR